MREQVERLKDHPDDGTKCGKCFALFGERLSVDGDGAGVDGFEAIDGAAQSRFTGARRTEDDHHLALGYLEIDLLQDVKFPEVFVHRGHRNHGCGIAGGGRRRRIVGLGHKREP